MLTTLNKLNQALIIQMTAQIINNDLVLDDQIVSARACIEAVCKGKIRLCLDDDHTRSAQDLADDCDAFSPEANPSVPRKTILKERAAFIAKVSRQGIKVSTMEYWTGRDWEGLLGIENNAIGGFVGEDIMGSGYELQLMQSALIAYNKQSLDEHGTVIDPYLSVA